MSTEYSCDVLIIGSGAAGLSLALSLSQKTKVIVLSKTSIEENATFYAQGGISAVVDESDSLDSHIKDTIRTGDGLCDISSVEFIVHRARDRVEWLSDKGVNFTKRLSKSGKTEFHLSQEGGHSVRRVVHAADHTGQAIENTLVEEFKNKKILFLDNHIAIDLVTKHTGSNKSCVGTYVLDKKTEKVCTITAQFTVLATGGAGKVYLYTSNPDVSTGDGVAMAWRIGCKIANMEFVQFHPTCLYHPHAKSLLLTEALRGEGGKLISPGGKPFALKYDKRGELAPRDIVAKAIDYEMKRGGSDCVYLDISHRKSEFIKQHFPSAYASCLNYGIDITKEPVPIVPAAHYLCGGILTNLNGETNIRNLYAIGETGYTGLHGANRMASNSLLECLVLADSCAKSILSKAGRAKHRPINIPDWDDTRVTTSDEEIMVSHNWDEIRRTMWDYVGIVRTDKRLNRAKKRIKNIRLEIDEYYSKHKVTSDFLELRNIALVADLIIQSALSRKESRGLHFNSDYPKKDQAFAKDTILCKN
ncbi:MAG: L-aspartate oxidase [Pseudomonadota bacterium]|nr:L-aspartate oxidase [Pseudomonadota bacterium]